MPLSFKDLNRKFNKSGVVYPAELIENIKDYPIRTALPTSVYVDDVSIAGIFLVCPGVDIDFFKINKAPPEPGMKFRFLEFESLSIIEIILYFKADRQLVLHLNPSAMLVKHFLNECIEQGMISFHFICPTRNILASSFTDIDEEQMEWAKRNYKRSLKLNPVTDYAFSIVSESQSLRFTSNQKHYSFGKVNEVNHLSFN